MPGSPYIDEVEGILDWRHVLSTICIVTLSLTIFGWYLGEGIGAIGGGMVSLTFLWFLGWLIRGKPLRPSPDHHDV